MERQGAPFTIDEWCIHRRVSRPTFYRLLAKGRAPHTYYVGNKRRISPEADAAWLREREAEATAKRGDAA